MSDWITFARSIALIAMGSFVAMFHATAMGDSFETTIRPLLKTYCLGCHSSEEQKGELDLERFESTVVVQGDPKVWQDVLQQITDGEMPPKDQRQFTPEERTEFVGWVRSTLDEVALASAGDPGPVVLRRLSNHEYTYTIRDLTGVASLDPASEFPIDGAAGEGFTNVGSALVMSPALLTKYLDAAKSVASHAVILPGRLQFSPSTSRADWTQEKLDAIRQIHARFAVPGVETASNLQGVQFSMTDGRVIPIERYLRAIDSGNTTGLSPKYLAILSGALESSSPSILLDPIRRRWQNRSDDDISEIAREIVRWQQSLWHFAKVGHIGKRDGPKSWQVGVMPIAQSQGVRLTMPQSSNGMTHLYLVAGDAGDGNVGDVVVWKDARLEFKGEPSIALGQVQPLIDTISQLQQAELARTSAYLDAVLEAHRKQEPVESIAMDRQLVPTIAVAWSDLVQLSPVTRSPQGHLAGKQSGVGGYDAIIGWGEGLPSLLANRSDSELAFSTLRVPGRGVTVHPTPDIDSVVYWRSPIDGTISLSGLVADMDAVCGNGGAWSVEFINAYGARKLAGDEFPNGGRQTFGPIDDVVVRSGDLIKFTVQPKQHDHACDTTQIALTVTESGGEARVWDLAGQIVDRLHDGNPLADTYGNSDVWHFCRSQGETPTHRVPPGSALETWRESILEGNVGNSALVQAALLDPMTDADQSFGEMCREFRGPLDWIAIARAGIDAKDETPEMEQSAPSILEFAIPAQFLAGAELVANVSLHPEKGDGGSVQAFATLERPAEPLELVPGQLVPGAESGELWTDGQPPVVSDRPILVEKGSDAEQRVMRDVAEFQSLFPAALCYDRIVPVDEVVTLTLRYREDEPLQRLMLSDDDITTLDRLWDEMLFVSRQPLQQLDAYNQLWQYATQDADPSAFEPMREPTKQAAAAFQQRLVDLEPAQLDDVLAFAVQAWRRPLTEDEQSALRQLYQRLKDQGLDHESALRQLLTRILMSPAFLYRGEVSPAGREPAPIDAWEMAVRLSYFLWSSAPDAELRAMADSGRLSNPDVLVEQMRCMLSDPKVRRLATEFGCQWLHVRDLETLDEKSERHFPTFASVRGDMQEEITRFFVDLFQANGSVLSLLDADHTFLNGALAEHYGVRLESASWQRVDGMRAVGRGGVLGFAGTLAKQSGASRTSPILRGNWVSETLLGEKLPRPPKNVPVLPDEAPEGLTERELIERHSSVAECARCHQRIDPLGFALEGFDAIGRSRTGLDTKALLMDGTAVDGIEGLRTYLRDVRRKDFLAQFCRKLLGYALGRGIQLSDQPLLESMVAKLEASDYRVETVIELIVLSPQFQQVRGRDFLMAHQTTE